MTSHRSVPTRTASAINGLSKVCLRETLEPYGQYYTALKYTKGVVLLVMLMCNNMQMNSPLLALHYRRVRWLLFRHDGGKVPQGVQ